MPPQWQPNHDGHIIRGPQPILTSISFYYDRLFDPSAFRKAVNALSIDGLPPRSESTADFMALRPSSQRRVVAAVARSLYPYVMASTRFPRGRPYMTIPFESLVTGPVFSTQTPQFYICHRSFCRMGAVPRHLVWSFPPVVSG